MDKSLHLRCLLPLLTLPRVAEKRIPEDTALPCPCVVEEGISRLLQEIRGLQIKPAKGRLKDLKRIDRLVEAVNACPNVS